MGRLGLSVSQLLATECPSGDVLGAVLFDDGQRGHQPGRTGQIKQRLSRDLAVKTLADRTLPFWFLVAH